MPQLFRTSMSLTFFIIVPMMVTNTVLSYLQKVEHQQELFILIVIGALLLLTISYLITVKPIIEKKRPPENTQTSKS